VVVADDAELKKPRLEHLRKARLWLNAVTACEAARVDDAGNLVDGNERRSAHPSVVRVSRVLGPLILALFAFHEFIEGLGRHSDTK
jgi:hypothetical protein